MNQMKQIIVKLKNEMILKKFEKSYNDFQLEKIKENTKNKVEITKL